MKGHSMVDWNHISFLETQQKIKTLKNTKTVPSVVDIEISKQKNRMNFWLIITIIVTNQVLLVWSLTKSTQVQIQVGHIFFLLTFFIFLCVFYIKIWWTYN